MFSFFKRKRSGSGRGRRRETEQEGRRRRDLPDPQMGNQQSEEPHVSSEQDVLQEHNPDLPHGSDQVRRDQSPQVDSDGEIKKSEIVISKNSDEKISKRELFFRSGAGSTVLSESVLKKVKSEGNLSVTKDEDINLNNCSQSVSNGSIESESEKCVNSDDPGVANEIEGSKSVTDKVGVYAEEAAKGENSAGSHPGSGVRGEARRDDMQRASSWDWACGEPIFQGAANKAEEEVFTSSSDEDSDDVVKNDSGCWDEREGRTSVNGILFSVGKNPREKKHVKWADIHGQTDLTRSQEDVRRVDDTSEEEAEEDSTDTEDESESEEEEKTNDVISEFGKGEDWAKPESSSSEESEEEGDNALPVTETISEVKNGGTIPAPGGGPEESEEEESEEEESEEEDKLDKSASELMSEVNEGEMIRRLGPEGSEDSSEDEEDSTDEEESPREEPVVNEEPLKMRINVEEMQRRITDLQREIESKTTNIGRLQVELDSACSESENVRQRFLRLEEDLESYRQSNRSLTQQLQITEKLEEEKISRSSRQLYDAEKRIRDLEAELENVRIEYNILQTSYKKLQADRDMEVQIIQKALEKALTDQEEMEAKYEKDFENLRTHNSGREIQMLEDFEWKLREVERNCKKKIQDYETEYEQKNMMLANQLASAQVDLEQISHLKLCEIELKQIKQTSSEQRKSLRIVNRKLEELQVSEKILQEEVSSLRSSLDKEKAHIVALQTMHKEELAEKERKSKIKMEIQIKQLTYEWAERLRNDNNKLKTDLEKTAREERVAAVDLAKKVKDQEISQLKQNWETKNQELKDEILKQKNRITEIENHHRNDLDNAQTFADRDAFDLRRKIDKLDMNYQEKIEKLQEKHESELASIREECEKRVQQSEVALQIQVGNSRTTLELVKQQLRNEAQSKLENLERQYQQKLEQQWAAFQREKEVSLGQQEEKHKTVLETIYKEIERTKKQARNEHDSLTKRRNQPPVTQSTRLNNHPAKIEDADRDGSSALLSRRLDVAEVAEEIRTQGKEEVLQHCIEQLTKQLNAGKMEIAKLREQLEMRETRPQQSQQQPPRNNIQHPVPNPRRNRKGRSGRN